DTSGLIVIAKNNITHENLSNQFSKHTIIRVYQLLIWGKLRPSFGKIDTFITRSSKNRQMMEVSSSKGKRAITNYKTIEEGSILEEYSHHPYNQKISARFHCYLCLDLRYKAYSIHQTNYLNGRNNKFVKKKIK
ncbi:pseudouridine synthase, partial [Candidatus Pelagibacter sp.]|nr:pseudouridine synthase [Candidatus Pelagibacter sp.]